MIILLISGQTDTTSVSLYGTTNYRQTEIGVMTIGAESSWDGILIPPGQTSFQLSYYCKASCLNVKILIIK